MARNGSGTYSLPEAAFVFDTVIDETAMNNNLSDIATALTGSIAANGETTISANLPMNSKKLTGMAAGTAATDSVTLGQFQSGAALHGGTAGGTVDAITFSVTPAITAYAAGQRFNVIAAGANTGPMTANANAVGDIAVKKHGGTALAAGDVPGAGFIMDLIHDGTDLELQNPASGKSASESAAGTVEIATQAEVNTGTDTTRSLTPATLKSHLTTPNPIGATTPSTGKFSTLEATTSIKAATGATITGIADEDDMTSNSATLLATQQSIKAYRDTPQSGELVQVVATQTGAVTTGTTIIPVDDTIPQNTEGDEVMTQAITPTSSSNTLIIDVNVFCSSSLATNLVVALFQDSTANALAATAHYQGTTGGGVNIRFSHKMTAGTASATTFKVRLGADGSATQTFNGISGGRIFGGVAASSLTIREIQA